MQNRKRVTFFMLVTERDCIIADYAVRSYQKIYEQKRQYGFDDFVLLIYLNCLSEKSKDEFVKHWQTYPYTFIYDNAEKLSASTPPFPGEKIVSPEGIERSRDDYAESYDELWTSELRKLDTPFIATVDADFEILDADFYFDLMNRLNADAACVGASSSYDTTNYLFDSYSKRNIFLKERNHTWFCIYKKEAFEISSISHFYFEELNASGEIVAYDSAAYFQHDLRTNHHRAFIHSPESFKSSFVHYGSASKNKSLTRDNIAYYRKAFLFSAIGIIFGETKNIISKSINKIARRIAQVIFGNYLNKIRVERSTYIFEDENN